MKNVLIGKTIARIDVASDGKAVRFMLDGGGDIVAKADGDCCSNTWIESFDTPELLIGGEVVAVEDLEMPDLGSPDEYEEIAYYGCKITTNKGACVIDYRNESNGYYGGDLSWPGGYFYGGVFNQNVSTEDWKHVAGADPSATEEGAK